MLNIEKMNILAYVYVFSDSLGLVLQGGPILTSQIVTFARNAR